ncbi:MAG: helix-turn-helix transcriptional regulator [Clostridia bacterium]|nr:helix-turn-helix transcriptional regulator [Clostridia bacterium]
MYELGEKLKMLRKEKGLSQAKVATRLNLSTSAISSYETYSKIPSAEVLIQLALFYNVSVDYLLGIDNRNFINTDGLTSVQKNLVEKIINEFRSQNN